MNLRPSDDRPLQMLKILSLFFQDSSKYVELLLQLFRRFSELVKDAFSDDPRFLTSRDKVTICVQWCKTR